MCDRKIEPDVITFNSLLDVCAKSHTDGNLAQAEYYFDRMFHHNVEPNNSTFNALIEVCAKSEKEAWESIPHCVAEKLLAKLSILSMKEMKPSNTCAIYSDASQC